MPQGRFGGREPDPKRLPRGQEFAMTKSPTRSSRLSVQTLEDRTTPVATLVSGDLNISGLPYGVNDDVRVSVVTISDQDWVLVEQKGLGATQRFPLKDVSRIFFFGESGDDTFRTTVSRPTHADGGPGNDNLTTYDQADILYGRDGSDTLSDGGGNDWLED